MTVLALSVLVGVVVGFAAFHWAGQLRSASGRRIGSAASPLGETVFQAICEAAPNAVVVSRAGQIIWVNPQYGVLFGCTLEAVVGQELTLRLPEVGVHLATRHAGSYFPVDVRQYPVSSAEGPLVVTIVRDRAVRCRDSRLRDARHGWSRVGPRSACVARMGPGTTGPAHVSGPEGGRPTRQHRLIFAATSPSRSVGRICWRASARWWPAGPRGTKGPARYRLAEATASTQRRIFVVEDNPVNQKVAAIMLQKIGCRIDIAPDGVEALEALRHRSYQSKPVKLADLRAIVQQWADASPVAVHPAPAAAPKASSTAA